jgi:hypothetical protein
MLNILLFLEFQNVQDDLGRTDEASFVQILQYVWCKLEELKISVFEI